MERTTLLLQLISMLIPLAMAEGGQRSVLQAEDFECHLEPCEDRLVCVFPQLGPKALWTDPTRYNLTLENSETVRCQQAMDNKTEIQCIFEGLRKKKFMLNESLKFKLGLKTANVVQIQEFNRTVAQNSNVTCARPRRPPQPLFNGFYYEPEREELHIYWHPLDEREFGSRDLRFRVVTRKGQMASVVGKTFAIFHDWNPEKPTNVAIWSENFLGRSGNSSHLRVPILTHANRRQPQDVRYHSENNSLTWRHPMEVEKLEDYTVYWCLSSSTSPNTCDDRERINSQTLDRSQTMFPFNKTMAEYRMAVVAAYSDEVSGGLRWSVVGGKGNSNTWVIVGLAMLVPLIFLFWTIIRELRKMSEISVFLPDFSTEDKETND